MVFIDLSGDSDDDDAQQKTNEKTSNQKQQPSTTSMVVNNDGERSNCDVRDTERVVTSSTLSSPASTKCENVISIDGTDQYQQQQSSCPVINVNIILVSGH